MNISTRALAVGAVATLAVSLGAVGAATSTATPADDDGILRIINGREATETYSFMISYGPRGRHNCGASLVSPNWAITAQHCVTRGVRGYSAIIGTRDRNNGGERIGIADVITHRSADLALLKLSQPARSTPIQIASSAGATGTATRLLGFGQTRPRPGDPGSMTDQLKEVDAEIVEGRLCRNNRWKNHEICTGGAAGTGACYGDSGGPQIKKVNGVWQLIGATSRGGRQCATEPSIYTDVTQFMDWFKQNTNGEVGNGTPQPPGNPGQPQPPRPTNPNPWPQPTGPGNPNPWPPRPTQPPQPPRPTNPNPWPPRPTQPPQPPRPTGNPGNPGNPSGPLAVYLKAESEWDGLIQRSNSVAMFAQFSASWCGPCRRLKPVMERLNKQDNSWLWVYIDTDQFRGLKSKYRVGGIPDVRVIKRGKEVDKMVGFDGDAGTKAFVDRNKARP